MAPGIAPSKGHGWGLFLPHKGRFMTRKQQTPTVQYCVEARLPGTKTVVDRFTIEQVECQRKFGCCDNGNYSTVQRHLSDLSRSSGLDYEIVRWGDPVDRSRWVAGYGFED